jgi:hypothetical protein
MVMSFGESMGRFSNMAARIFVNEVTGVTGSRLWAILQHDIDGPPWARNHN